MLAGNLASIGVGGIVTCVTSYFWPEDFDFDITRAINAPQISSVDEKPAPLPQNTPEMDDEKKRDSVSAEVNSISSAQPSEDNELDPAMLNKAFRFAAWSSVILVRHRVVSDVCAALTVRGYYASAHRHASRDSAASVLRTDGVWGARTGGVGGHRLDLDLYVRVLRRAVSSLGEPRGARAHRERYDKGESA